MFIKNPHRQMLYEVSQKEGNERHWHKNTPPKKTYHYVKKVKI